MGLPEEVGKTTRSAISSWQKTMRLCLILFFAGAACAAFLYLYVTAGPAIYGTPIASRSGYPSTVYVDGWAAHRGTTHRLL